MSFFVFFTSLYGSAHVYLLLRLRRAFRLRGRAMWAAGATLASLVFAPALIRALERHGAVEAARIAGWIGFSWLGFLFFFTWVHAALDLAGLIDRAGRAIAGLFPRMRNHRRAFLAVAAATGVMGCYAFFEAANIRPEHVTIVSDRLPPGHDRLRIAQISDLHLGMFIRQDVARRVAGIVREERPDLFVSTGDLVDGSLEPEPGLAEIFRSIDAPAGKFAVTGNHEYYAGIDRSVAFTKAAGFEVLRNEAVDAGGFRVAGVDDEAGMRFGEKTTGAEAALVAAGRSPEFTLFLKHRPALTAGAAGRFDLQLSGHTHQGQLFPFRYLVQLRFPNIYGLYRLGGESWLYTSRGTGTWGPRMRLFSPPEVTIIDVVRPTGR